MLTLVEHQFYEENILTIHYSLQDLTCRYYTYLLVPVIYHLPVIYSNNLRHKPALQTVIQHCQRRLSNQ
jgi:hypothetical protein